MREPTPPIDIFVQEQFPAFYQEEGPAFTAFIEAYYEWLDQPENVLGLGRNIYNLRDIDRTIDDFVIYFRTKFLANFGYLSEVDIRKLVKHSRELFGAKGTQRGFKLLFQLLFNQEINVYYPGNDVLRASDGKWFQPKYLEISPNPKNVTYLYKEIVGTTSGAKAFVEGIVRRTIGTRIFDVFYISNIRGAYEAGERITADGTVAGSPVVLGSLIEIDITNGGAGFSIGDIVDIVDASGVDAQARVTAVENATGKVSFTLNDGGTGYRLSSSVMISDKTLKIVAANTSFTLFEPVNQTNQTVSFYSANGSFTNGASITGTGSANATTATGTIIQANSTAVIVNYATGSFTNADSIWSSGHKALINVAANAIATGTFLGYTPGNQNIGLDSVVNTFYVGAPIQFSLSNVSANVVQIYTGNGAGFGIGSLTNDENVELWTDLLAANNSGGVPFLSIILSGSNANVAGNTYGFPKPITGFSANLDSLITSALDRNDFTVGTIASINQVRPGDNYNADPFIQVYDPLIAGFDRRNLIFAISNANGVMIQGERVEQDIQVPGYDLTIVYSGNTTFTPNEGITQTNTGAVGTVVSGNSTHLIVSSYNGIAFGVGNTIIGSTSNAHANTSANTYLGSEVTATGIVVSANGTVVEVAPTSVNTLFDSNFSIVGQTSNSSANIASIDFDNSLPPMGLNANVTGRVVTANGVISEVVPVNSGFGYTPGEALTLFDIDNVTVAEGTAHLDSFGTGQGYWKNTDGFLDSDKFLHDNDYYQSYSYEIQTGISLSRYADVLKKSFHIAGTKLFGKVVRVEKIREVGVSIDGSVTTA